MADEKGKVFTDFMEWQKEKRKNIKIMFEIIEYLKSHEIYWEMDHMEGIPRITMVFKNCDTVPILLPRAASGSMKIPWK